MGLNSKGGGGKGVERRAEEGRVQEGRGQEGEGRNGRLLDYEPYFYHQGLKCAGTRRYCVLALLRKA